MLLSEITTIFLIKQMHRWCMEVFATELKIKKVIATFYLTILTFFLAIVSFYPAILTL